MKELPRVEQEVKDQIEAWEKETGTQFLVSGQGFVDFIQRQWDEYKTQKEKEKEERVS